MPHIYCSNSDRHLIVADEYDRLERISKETTRHMLTSLVTGDAIRAAETGVSWNHARSGWLHYHVGIPQPLSRAIMRRDRFRWLGPAGASSKRILTFLLLLAACWGDESAQLLARHPNLVIVLADDTVAPLNRQRIDFKSSADGTQQQAILIAPQAKSTEPVPMVVNLHSWSADLTQRSDLERLVHDRGWYYLFPNFRGANQTPQACGSPLAQQDVLDAVDWVLAHHPVDSQRIYLTGASGGGHMTMLMAGRYPDRWRAASAWVGISDLVSWHEKHRGSRYGDMMEKCCGGAPGDSADVDRQYQLRSPIHVIEGARNLPLDLLAGADDGHTGSVPIRHSIDAFNKIARANQTPVVTEQEIQQLSARGGRLAEPRDGDVGFDPALGRDYFLRRRSKAARLTIFDGGHESVAQAIIDWFEQQP